MKPRKNKRKYKSRLASKSEALILEELFCYLEKLRERAFQQKRSDLEL
jgi:hypothetical protein